MSAIPQAATDAIIRAGQRMDQRGWVPATAGNLSVRLADGSIAITRSGGHKGFLGSDDVMAVDVDGRALDTALRPSAETLLHCQIYRAFPGVGAVLHGHSVAGTVLSMQERADRLMFAGYELFKAVDGQTTHVAELALPLLANDQDISRLAQAVAPVLPACKLGYYIRGHGVYVWGRDMDRAMAALEAIEFLLECELARRRV